MADQDQDEAEEATVARYVLPTHTSELSFLSLRSGKLHIKIAQEGKACAWVGDRQVHMFWPPDYTVLDTPLRLVNEKDETVAEDGDQVTVGGGNAPPISDDCPGESGFLAWYVSGVGKGDVP